MKILVTGAAGFIGSHLCETLLINKNYHVVGIDGYINNSLDEEKRGLINRLLKNERFTFYEENMLNISWDNVISEIDVIYHLAGIPGVRASWGENFNDYVIHNIQATQRLLEACIDKPRLQRFIYASTSSVYGEKHGKVSEDATPRPLSPYGVTKLTCENLFRIYYQTYRLPIVILRYFTVFGPRQRDDMAFHIFIKKMLSEETIPVFGDGLQTRDFTYIRDCIAATISALHSDNVIGETINIGGKERASMIEIIEMLEEIIGKSAKVNFLKKIHGEPKHTWANINKAQRLLNYNPTTKLKEGIENEVKYIRELYR
ncbi:NAD-dependent epimerase/dehydratase family protein [Evansella cellulosilytica]|uniref:NAD-dependent epimerase/dehydratase n=1 Tax=Evansella cellulosilytica (strain ATCC 21833 / DSM 2522 / FERM P-1141 / JCM 9156 / N-4) TaxID=649639 RepID=E6TWC8_EVAC2|nr:NAD-dependent epimerase/dehydratase family protein [Evansella cellulosilytica]ADU31084.1 NAD-dependent epimerase/dehydratase [Evansella cellulosilytica DSM 2522]